MTGNTVTADMDCPAGCQASVDGMYTDCDSELGDAWESSKPTMKAGVEAIGCGGAAEAAPAIFVALAAVASHFLN